MRRPRATTGRARRCATRRCARPRAGRAGAGRERGARRRADGAAGVAHHRAPMRRAGPCCCSGSQPLGSAADPARPRGARTRDEARRRTRAVCAAAALAACHAQARRASDTDWAQIVALYDALAEVAPSPVVELNRAVAVGMAFGPAAALELVDALRDDPALARYHWLPSVRGDLLAKLGRADEAKPNSAARRTDAQRTRTRITAQARDGRVTHAARANAGPGCWPRLAPAGWHIPPSTIARIEKAYWGCERERLD